MALTVNGFWSASLWVALAAGLSAQAPAPPPAQTAPPGSKPTFKAQVDLVTDDVIVRDTQGNFVSDLKRDDFEVYEDGVKQEIASMVSVTGGRVTNVLAPPPPPPPEGIVLPPSRPRNDESGRIFLFFVDDLHLAFQNTPRVRQLFKQMSKNLLHDGDMWGMVSSGPSSIAIDMNYNKARFDEAINKIAGNELTPTDIIQGATTAEGPSEVRYRAHVAFTTVEDILRQLNQVHNRRKALIYVSDGYDFNPFLNARFASDPNSPFQQNFAAQMTNTDTAATGAANMQGNDPNSVGQKGEFAAADLARELADLTTAANRANTTIYTIDPRGLVGPMGDMGENVDPSEWNDFVRNSQDSLRVLAEMTGGTAVVNQNDFDKALKRIDAETGDYYVLGYYSSNPDPTKRRRSIEVKVKRPGLSVWSRREYVLNVPPPAAAKKPSTQKDKDK
jgi:VWFA-related protein